jgi:hypothetical protein
LRSAPNASAIGDVSTLHIALSGLRKKKPHFASLLCGDASFAAAQHNRWNPLKLTDFVYADICFQEMRIDIFVLPPRAPKFDLQL